MTIEQAREETKQLAVAIQSLLEVLPYTEEVKFRTGEVSKLLFRHMRTLNELSKERVNESS